VFVHALEHRFIVAAALGAGEAGGIGGRGGRGGRGWRGRRGEIGRIEDQDDTLADAVDAADDLALDCVDRRIDGTEDEWTVEHETLEAASDDVTRQRLEVDNDVGKLGDIIFSAS
jgi:hypothetical protein